MKEFGQLVGTIFGACAVAWLLGFISERACVPFRTVTGTTLNNFTSVARTTRDLKGTYL